MAEETEISLANAVRSTGLLNLYGKRITGISGADFVSGRGADAPVLSTGLIRAFSWGSYCRPLPFPMMLIVPGAGKEVTDNEGCGRKGEIAWEVMSTADIAHLEITNGTAIDLLGELEEKGVSGGIAIENPRFDGSRFCATIHFWGKIEVFGASAKIDERVNVCIPLEGCHTVWDAGIARVEVCFRAPNQLCAKACIGKWGLEKCWDACVAIPIAQAVPGKSGECGCS